MIEFEIKDRDLLARIGKLKTKSGTVETPVFLPVINPNNQTVTSRELWTDYKCKMLITNAYIIKNQFEKTKEEIEIHKLLKFPGVIMTDSGAYQILNYGKIDILPKQIIRFQEMINTDIATILDIPTSWRMSKNYAQYTVEETLRRANDLKRLKTRGDIAWIGPVQGGRYLDLIVKSAREISEIPFEIQALGSPTPIMEQYFFDLLVDMVLTAKMNLPSERPFHLFGAGHPFMFSLAIAMGCDMFDSAAYVLFAKEDRYLTDKGTFRIEKLEYLPCSCPICTSRTLRDLKEMPKKERERNLSRHNLYVCFSEIKKIKQSIVEGRLWEHVEMRAHSHPSLFQAFKRLLKYSKYLEPNTPITKKNGLFFFSGLDLTRPEMLRYEERLFERYSPPEGIRVLILFPKSKYRSIRRSKSLGKTVKNILINNLINRDEVKLCVYVPPFGVIPNELEGIYPLSQYEFSYPPDPETINYMAVQIVRFIQSMKFEKTFIFKEKDTWQEEVTTLCSEICAKKGVNLNILTLNDQNNTKIKQNKC
jgi:7-cyano-7-deazaguanine tRNA-ribosyltransferase